jgi:hypothetical protein
MKRMIDRQLLNSTLDKGTVIISAFGLPPLAHERDSYLAVLVAMKFREEFSKGEPLGGAMFLPFRS